MGVVEGNKPATDNEWERIANGGNLAIQRWIDRELGGKSCNVVLIGENTAGRKWINYEVKESWNGKKGVVGVHIHRLRDLNGYQSRKGSNPFEYFRMEDSGKKLSSVVKAYNPPYTQTVRTCAHTSTTIYSIGSRKQFRFGRNKVRADAAPSSTTTFVSLSVDKRRSS
jgi:hypothetical protein